jgi:hypothetical protein
MKNSNIVKKLEKLGKTVEYKKFGYWDNIAHCDGTAIAEYTRPQYNSVGIETDFKFDDVLSKIGKYSDMSGRFDLQGNPQEDYFA